MKIALCLSGQPRVVDVGYHKLKQSIQNHVKLRLAAHEYPRLIEFVYELPLTTTGKIIRKDLRENI